MELQVPTSSSLRHVCTALLQGNSPISKSLHQLRVPAWCIGIPVSLGKGDWENGSYRLFAFASFAYVCNVYRTTGNFYEGKF